MQHNARITAECRLCGRIRAAQTEPPARPSGARVNSARARGGTGPGGRSFVRDLGVSRGPWGPVFLNQNPPRTISEFRAGLSCLFLFICIIGPINLRVLQGRKHGIKPNGRIGLISCCVIC